MNVRSVSVSAAALLLVGSLAACTTTIEGTPGPRPSVSASGDFPTDEPTDGTPTDEPTDSTPTDAPTDAPTDSTPTDTPTGGDTASVQTLCSRLDYAVEQGSDVDPEVVRSYVSTMILLWGIANSDDDPYSSVDAATTSACPDSRSAVLKQMKLPDLKSTKK